MVSAVAIVGSTGFIGSECARALESHYEVRRVRAPRFRASARSLQGLRAEIDWHYVEAFAEQAFDGVDVVVNAAGIASATSTDLPSLLGANALVPLLLARAAALRGVERLVHVSSAAVQGGMTLDETEQFKPVGLYALSKAIGEALLRDEPEISVVRYRPTSVQGISRSVTNSLLKLAESPFAAVAAPGDDPSPQMPIGRAAEAVRLLVESSEPPPPILLHPWEGTTTRSVLTELGGREPRLVNRVAARRGIRAAHVAEMALGTGGANTRRLDLLLFGQRQEGGTWLAQRLPTISPTWLSDIRTTIIKNRQDGPL